jgi:hypothetical protein
MALQSSGNAISFSDIQTEFGGESPISMSEYYQDAVPALVTANNANVGDVGEALALSDFYDGVLATLIEFEMIGGGGGGAGWGGAAGGDGGATSISATDVMFDTGGTPFGSISKGGGAGGSGYNGTNTSENGDASYYGAGGQGGANSTSGNQTSGYPPAATSYGAGGGSGGTNFFSGSGPDGGHASSRLAFSFYGVPSGSITVTIGAGGAGGIGGFTNGGAGAAGYAKFTVGNDVQEFTSSGTYTVPS